MDPLDLYLKPQTEAPPAAPITAAPSPDMDPLDIYLKQPTKTEIKKSEGTGIPYGLVHGLSNILSLGGQAAQAEMSQPIDVPGTEQTFNILQKNVTGPLSPGTALGRNVGEILPYAALSPTTAGILPRLIGAGVSGAGQTIGETFGGPVGGIIGGLISPYAVAKTLPLAGKTFANITGAMSGVGETPVTKAFTTGIEGGAAGETFRASQAGNLTPSQLVEEATKALTNMRLARSQKYQSSMAAMSKDSTVLSFNDIDKAMEKANKIKTFKGENLSPETQDVQDQVNKAIERWRNLNPLEYHTPSGMDALKQRLGSIKDNLPFNTPQRKVVEDAYNAVRQTIVKQAPDYGKTMSGYEEASSQIDEIRKTLSLNPKASVDTAFRKLLSTMRNNANTNYGQRVDLVQELEKNGAPNLSAALAGQSMRSFLPHGLARGVAAPEALLAGYETFRTGGPKALMTAAAMAPLQSPRILGAGTHALGRLYGSLGLPGLGQSTTAQIPFALSQTNPLLNLTQPQ